MFFCQYLYPCYKFTNFRVFLLVIYWSSFFQIQGFCKSFSKSMISLFISYSVSFERWTFCWSSVDHFLGIPCAFVSVQAYFTISTMKEIFFYILFWKFFVFNGYSLVLWSFRFFIWMNKGIGLKNFCLDFQFLSFSVEVFGKSQRWLGKWPRMLDSG